MSAPANDLIANAAIITGLSGTVAGTTVGALVEAGEVPWPANALALIATVPPASTVWYEWVCPAIPAPSDGGAFTYDAPLTGEFVFTTDDTTINFLSAVQVFSPPSGGGTVTAANVVETVPLLSERVGRNCGAANGAAVSFIATVGATYYIRVGGRNSTQGIFNLRWRQYDRTTLGSCNDCGPTSLGKQVGTLRIADVTVDSTQSFPNGPFPAGLYVVAWCKGAFIFRTNEPYWNVSAVGAGSPEFIFNWPESSWTLNNGAFYSEGETEVGTICAGIQSFFTCGGDISMTFNDTVLQDNINNSPNPVFQLIAINTVWPTPQIVGSLGESIVLSVSGTACDVRFSIQNNLTYSPGPLTATLLNTGGVTGASAPVTITLGANGAFTGVEFTFTASPTTVFTTATIELTSACLGLTVAIVTFPLYPVIVLTQATPGAPPADCSPSGTRTQAHVIANLTVIGDSMSSLGASTASVVATSSPQPLVSTNSGCSVLASQTFTLSSDGNTDLFSWVLEASSPTVDTISYATTWGSLTYPPFSININAP